MKRPTSIAPDTVVAVVRLGGVQPSRVGVQHPRTPEAVVTIAIARTVIYLHTRAAAVQLGDLAERAAPYMLALPTSVPLSKPAVGDPTDGAHASIIVHTTGAPGGVVHLRRPTADLTYLHLQIGDLVFHLRDRTSTHICVTALRRAAELAEQLPERDHRFDTPAPAAAPSFAGADAALAYAELDDQTPRDVHQEAKLALAYAQRALGQAGRALTSLSSTHQPGPDGNPAGHRAPSRDAPRRPLPQPRRSSGAPTGTITPTTPERRRSR